MLRQAGAFLDELIEERRLADAFIEEAEIAVAEVIDQNVDDVGACHVMEIVVCGCRLRVGAPLLASGLSVFLKFSCSVKLPSFRSISLYISRGR